MMSQISYIKLNKNNLCEANFFDISFQIAQLEEMIFVEDSWNQNTIQHTLDNEINNLVIAYYNEQIIGFCLYQRVFETAEILRIAVNRLYRQQGIASTLLEQVVSDLQIHPVERLMLEVRQDNLSAIRLYHKFQFEQIAMRKHYYKNLDGTMTHAIIMEKTLKIL